MARRRNSRPVDDFVSAVASLPWWVYLAAALISHLVLATMASPALRGIEPGQALPVTETSLIEQLAMAGQFVIPIFCLAGAMISVAKGQRRRRRIARVTQTLAPDALDAMTSQELELLVGEAFALQGYEVATRDAWGPHRSELVLRKDHGTFLVQCKHWKALKVGVQAVYELSNLMTAKGVAGGFVVTSGVFTEEATLFAGGHSIRLIDGANLLRLIQQAKAARSNQGRAAASTARRPVTPFGPSAGA